MNIKKRNWAFVLYPESAPADWLERLQATGLPGAISPLHDKDIDPTGIPKKPHYHVILCYAGPTSYNVVKSLTDSLNQPVPQALEQVKGYYRYLTHMDNPDKYQYASADIVHLNGFALVDYAELTRSEVDSIKAGLIGLCRNLGICEYSVLMDYLLDNDLRTEFGVAAGNTLFFDRYLTSLRHKQQGAGGAPSDAPRPAAAIKEDAVK